MFNKNSNWSKIAIVVILGLLVSIAIPAMKKMRDEKESYYINNNFKLIVAAGKRYMAEHGVAAVPFYELKDLYLEEVVLAAGENYDNLQIEFAGVISVETQNGRIIEYAY